ncbi:H-NS family histone-like protein [Leclercia adecarboxylata]|uniref:H-NS family histone-like protein n=1 Tax=Leclercia adecarboxylata TaxID=83655 RepID=UPI0011DF2CF6|nr:H-NS family nucleoid-associated regulatory protein [Leclercia adecarboxylata]
MSDLFKQLNNIRILRAQARDLTMDVLEDVLEKFNVIVAERREEETARLTNESQRREKLESLRRMMLEDGIDPSELMVVKGKSANIKKATEPRPAKYHYTDESGKARTWTGQGRMPKRITDQLIKGAKLEDFEIR